MTANRAILLLSLATLAVGCKDVGLEGNIPLAEARAAPPPPLEAAATAADRVEPARLVVDGRLWVPHGRPASYAEAALRPIGSADGHTVHARRWDRPPYGTLFVGLGTTAGGGAEWQPYAPVIGRSYGQPEGPAR